MVGGNGLLWSLITKKLSQDWGRGRFYISSTVRLLCFLMLTHLLGFRNKNHSFACLTPWTVSYIPDHLAVIMKLMHIGDLVLEMISFLFFLSFCFSLSFSFLTVPCSLWDLSSTTRDWIQAVSGDSMESSQGIPWPAFFSSPWKTIFPDTVLQETANWELVKYF